MSKCDGQAWLWVGGAPSEQGRHLGRGGLSEERKLGGEGEGKGESSFSPFFFFLIVRCHIDSNGYVSGT